MTALMEAMHLLSRASILLAAVSEPDCIFCKHEPLDHKSPTDRCPWLRWNKQFDELRERVLQEQSNDV